MSMRKGLLAVGLLAALVVGNTTMAAPIGYSNTEETEFSQHVEQPAPPPPATTTYDEDEDEEFLDGIIWLLMMLFLFGFFDKK